MVIQIFAILSQGVNAVATWFEGILNSMGVYGIVVGIVCLAIFFRLCINPLFMGRTARGYSDSVKKAYSTDTETGYYGG